jgi:Transcriptional repressor TCF25
VPAFALADILLAFSALEQPVWYTYTFSEEYQRDLTDFRQVQQSGDLNALIMFVAHHAFVPEALLQLSTILYQTDHQAEGLTFLRRCLWVYECAALRPFARAVEGSAFLDSRQLQNHTFFQAMRRLVQVSGIAA